MKNVLVFATSVDSVLAVRTLSQSLDALCGANNWNFDLDDCDRILRVTSDSDPVVIAGMIHCHGFSCQELNDEIPQDEMLRQLQVR